MIPETPAREQLRLLYEHSQDAILAADAQGRYVFANGPALAMLRYSADELLNQPLEFLRPSLPVSVAALAARATTGVFDIVLRAKCGQEIPLRTSIWTLKLAGALYYVASGRDLREVRRLEQQHEDSALRFQLMFEGAMDALFWEDGEGTVLDANPTACRLFGVPREHFLGKNFATLMQPFWSKEHYDAQIQVLRSTGKLVFDLELPTRYQTKIIGELRIHELKTPVGARRLVTVRDVTEQRRAEKLVQELQKREAVAALATGVAHEFNSLLTRIGFHAELALTVRGGSDDLAAIAEAARRGEQLTRALLEYGRPVARAPRPLEVNRVVSEFAGLLRRTVDAPMRIRLEKSERPVFAALDPVRFDQVLLNLALNARDALKPEGGQLTIAVGSARFDPAEAKEHGLAPGDWVRITVQDDGAGMDEKTLARAFEAFFTTRPERRSGLGLTVARALVEQHQGVIHATSTSGAGTTFSIYLPRVAFTPVPEGIAVPRGDEAVLLIEPDEALRRATARALSQLGYATSVARDPEEAERLKRSRTEPFALQIADVAAQADARCAQAKRTLWTTTARASTDTRVLQKPFSVEVLARAVRAALDEG